MIILKVLHILAYKQPNWIKWPPVLVICGGALENPANCFLVVITLLLWIKLSDTQKQHPPLEPGSLHLLPYSLVNMPVILGFKTATRILCLVSLASAQSTQPVTMETSTAAGLFCVWKSSSDWFVVFTFSCFGYIMLFVSCLKEVLILIGDCFV